MTRKKSDQPNWQPEHFTVGTIVTLKDYGRDENGKVVFAMGKTANVTVVGVHRGYPNNWCIQTHEPSFQSHASWNFSHVCGIVERGSEKVNYIEHKRESRKTQRQELSNGLYNPNKFHWFFGSTIEEFFLAPHMPHSQARLREGFAKFIMQQSFVKKVPHGQHFVLHSANKKRMKRFIRQNINRWLLSAKELLSLSEKYESEMNDIMEDDFVPEPVVLRGKNEHGNNQFYQDGEAVCSNCLAPYTNVGPSPLGMGTACPNCQAEDIHDSRRNYLD